MLGDQATGYMQAAAAAVTDHYDNDMFLHLFILNCAQPRSPALVTRRKDNGLSVFASVMITFDKMRQRGYAFSLFLLRLHKYISSSSRTQSLQCNL